MSYDYKTERKELFTEDGHVMFIKIRDTVKTLLHSAGAFRMQEALRNCSGSSWTMLACVDRLVELGEIREVTPQNSCAGQYRIFTEKP